MDTPSDTSPGFVYDASSGLYYDASSGFFYDAKAGWYYNTQNGQYYIYENDAYVPLTMVKEETAPPASGDESAEHLSVQKEEIREEAPITLSPSREGDREAGASEESAMKDAECRQVQNAAENSIGVVPGTEMSLLSMGKIADEAKPEETRLASVWIAETLSELYSQNTFEGGESVDPSSLHMYYQSDSTWYDHAYMRGDLDEEAWQEAQYRYRKQWGDSVAWDDQYESDDQSEELEEGEWRPVEEEIEGYVFDEVEDGEIREDSDGEPGISGVDGEGRANQGNHQHELAESSYLDGEGIDLSAEEQWQALYLQPAKPKARSYTGSMDLWDWSILEQEKKIGKKKVKKIFRLIGRLAPNATQVHPSLRGSGGLIRTTPICEADHEFVKVSSGRIYKLRRPSSKHVTAYPGYVSSNPTQDWGLPLINVNTEDDEEEDSDTILDPADATLSSSRRGNTHKKRNARLKSKGVDGGSELKYRDRAAERRTLHKGFGIGPGQKVVSVHELEKEEAEAATEMPAALKKAASARPIGKDNIGKRMLEGMGWKEGQSLGSGEGGLVDPILASGNTGRTGLGWL